MSDHDETIGGRTKIPALQEYIALSELAETWSAMAVERFTELEALWERCVAFSNDAWLRTMERDAVNSSLQIVTQRMLNLQKRTADLERELKMRNLMIDSLLRTVARTEEQIQKLEEIQKPASSHVEIAIPVGGDGGSKE